MVERIVSPREQLLWVTYVGNFTRSSVVQLVQQGKDSVRYIILNTETGLKASKEIMSTCLPAS